MNFIWIILIQNSNFKRLPVEGAYRFPRPCSPNPLLCLITLTLILNLTLTHYFPRHWISGNIGLETSGAWLPLSMMWLIRATICRRTQCKLPPIMKGLCVKSVTKGQNLFIKSMYHNLSKHYKPNHCFRFLSYTVLWRTTWSYTPSAWHCFSVQQKTLQKK